MAKLFKYLAGTSLVILAISAGTGFAPTECFAAKGSAKCKAHCVKWADSVAPRNTSQWSSAYDGCMSTCDM